MNSFVNPNHNIMTHTTNGMAAFSTTKSACLDMFYKIGAMRGRDIVPIFKQAYEENPVIAAKVAQWARDVRGGAGERKSFRDILLYLEKTDSHLLRQVLNNVPEIGRWDDLLLDWKTSEIKLYCFELVRKALFNDKNGLCAKWMPRKGPIAIELRNFFGLSPKKYRQLIVGLTKVVETQMCANQWENISFSHVPSQALSIYKKAFNRHTPKFASWIEDVKNGNNNAKVNAAAIYPHIVLKGWRGQTATENAAAEIQWEALPNYMTNGNVLPMVDVSGSMGCPAGGSKTITCMDVAVALGLYCADKNKGFFKDFFLTFSTTPKFEKLEGNNIIEKAQNISCADWAGSTNFEAALNLILSRAKQYKIPAADMPTTLLVLSDMQFNQASSSYRKRGITGLDLIRKNYAEAGYKTPTIVFWNLNSYDNTPATEQEDGVALVSGFSPAILKSVLAADVEKFTPYGVMMETISSERYNLAA